MKKTQITTIKTQFYFFIQKNSHFVRTHIQKNLVYIIKFVLQSFRVTGYWKCSNKTPMLIQISIGFVDAVLPPKILDNRLGILTQILKAMVYYFFFLCISQRSTFNLIKQSIYQGKCFDSPHSSNRIYLLQSCKFLNFTVGFTKKYQTF